MTQLHKHPQINLLLAIWLILVSSTGQAAIEHYNPLSPLTPHHQEPLDLVVDSPTGTREIPLWVYLPTTPHTAAVVLYSHGLGGSRKGSSYLGKHWSQRGYVAVFVQHPGSDVSIWKGKSAQARQAAFTKAATAENFMHRVRDIHSVLDQLERWNVDEAHALAGRLDLTRIGMSGHSFGAITTQAVSGQATASGLSAFTDDRIKAAVVFSPSAPRQGNATTAFSNVQLPWMLMTGTKDFVPVGPRNIKTRLAVYPALPPGGKYELVLHRAEHSAFTDRVLPGRSIKRNPNHHQVILGLSTAFWDTWLQKDPGARRWLHGEGPATLLEAKDRWQLK